MHRFSLVTPLLLCLAACDSASDAAERPKASEKAKPAEKSAESAGEHPNFVSVNVPVGGDIQTILSDHVAKAKAAGLKPHVELWADWCPPCKAIEGSMDDPRMSKAFAGVYLIRFDVDQWGDKLEGTGMSGMTIPVFYELDANAKVTGRSIDGGAWGDNIPENMAPPLDAYFHADKS
jgi:thiol-disulfide isomerase/thioredoxin